MEEKKREDNTPKVIDMTEHEEDITVFLKNEYPIIYEAYQNDDYTMEYIYPNFFHEIIYDDKIVGFYTYDEVKEYQDQICITEFYIIPEYRGNKIMINTLIDLTINNKKFTIYKPTQRVIEIFIENNMAWHFSKNLVRSIFKLSSRYNDVFKNKKISNCYYDIDLSMGMIDVYTNLYDTNTCSIIFNDTMNLITDEEMICMSNPRQYDLQRYNLSKKLKKVDKKYMRNNYKNIVRNVLKNEEKEAEVMEKILSDIGVEQIITEEEIDKIHKDKDIPVETLKNMINDVQKALDNNDINYEHIRTRFEFLVDNDICLDEEEDSFGCDYCGEVTFKKGICQICGYNQFDKRLEKIKDKIENQVDSSTGLYNSLLEKIASKNLDINMVKEAQIEIAEVSLLKFLDNMGDHSFLVNFDDDYEISEEYYIKSLLDKKLIEATPNPNVDDDKSMLYNMKLNNDMPTITNYKFLKHMDYIFKINKKGRRYYKTNKCAKLYLEYVPSLPYYEFKQYYNENITKVSKTELLRNFIKIEEDNAVENNDEEKYLDICLSKVELSSDDYEKSVNILQSVICSLNSYYSKKVAKVEETPLSIDNELFIEENIDMLRQQNLDEIFNEAYDNIGIASLRHDKDDRYDDVKDIINAEDVISVNTDLLYKYLEI